jgi:hypothetical protein
MARVTGGCVCGAIRYECDAEPIMMFKCHCRDCQHVSGGGYAPVLLFPRKDVRITKGEMQQYATRSMAGGENVRGLCTTCGSRISGGKSPDSIGILAGSLDDPSLFRPTLDMQVADAQAWDILDPSAAKFDRYPTA